MKNTFGNTISLTLFGESHGPAIGAVLDGLPPGLVIDEKYIGNKLRQRRAQGKISTARQEEDRVEFVSGVFEGRTTGTPLCLLIRNEKAHSADYGDGRKSRPARPSHADYTGFCKYEGYEDYRGGGHFSGRITAPLVAAGAILAQALEGRGIYIGTHILHAAGVDDRRFADYAKEFAYLDSAEFPVLDAEAGALIRGEILKAAADGDSIGGILETAVTGLPAGVGEPWFDTLEGMLAHAVFAIPAVKGIQFGGGFALADLRGSQANDAFYMDAEGVKTRTNYSGGIQGGISNGMPIVFETVVKPTASIFKKQETIDLLRMENTTFELQGRHDPAIFHRARPVVDAVTAIVLADLLTARFGTDYLRTGGSADGQVAAAEVEKRQSSAKTGETL